MRPLRVRPYRQLAEYYDRLFASGRAWGEAAHAHFLAKILPRVETICDLAAGSGASALDFARQGYRVYTVDLSPGMCRLTRQKARAAGLKLRVQCADMRDFALPEPVDLVLCEFDALNHVPECDDLPRVVRAVADSLRPGGYFYFDVNNWKSFREAWPRTWMLEDRDVVAVLHGGADPLERRAWCEVDWFIRQGAQWRRRRERVEEVCWTPAEIQDALASAGFDQVRTADAARFYMSPVLRRGHRTLYLARKGKTNERGDDIL